MLHDTIPEVPMRKYLNAVVALALALAAAYTAGYWSERGKRVAAERQLATAQASLSELEARDGLCRLEGELLALIDVVQQQNYGEARTRSTPFFDAVRAEISRPAPPARAAALDEIQKTRDTVTTALVQGDPNVIEALRADLTRLRAALGQPIPPRPTPPPASTIPQ
jgi:predicted metal-dependent hydrolase